MASLQPLTPPALDRLVAPVPGQGPGGALAERRGCRRRNCAGSRDRAQERCSRTSLRVRPRGRAAAVALLVLSIVGTAGFLAGRRLAPATAPAARASHLARRVRPDTPRRRRCGVARRADGCLPGPRRRTGSGSTRATLTTGAPCRCPGRREDPNRSFRRTVNGSLTGRRRGDSRRSRVNGGTTQWILAHAGDEVVDDRRGLDYGRPDQSSAVGRRPACGPFRRAGEPPAASSHVRRGRLVPLARRAAGW